MLAPRVGVEAGSSPGLGRSTEEDNGQSQKIALLMMDPSLSSSGTGRHSHSHSRSHLQNQMQHLNAPPVVPVSVYTIDDPHSSSSPPHSTPPLSSSRSPGGTIRKVPPTSSSAPVAKKNPALHSNSNKASSSSPLPANFTRSTSSDSSMYNEILKDLRIVHPSLRGKQQQTHPPPPVKTSQEEAPSVATVSTDESDANSLFLSSLSSNSTE